MVCTFTNVVQQIEIFFPRKGLVNRKLTEFKSSESEQLTSLRKFLKLRRATGLFCKVILLGRRDSDWPSCPKVRELQGSSFCELSPQLWWIFRDAAAFNSSTVL